MLLASLGTRLVAFVVAFVLLGSLSSASPDTFLETLTNATAADSRGSYAEAERLLTRTLHSLSDPAGRDAVVLWSEIGHVHQEQLRLEEAQRDYRKALEINTQRTQPDQSETATLMNNLATLALTRGELPEANGRVAEARAVLEKAGLADSASAGLVFSNSCLISQKLGKYDEARQFCSSAERVILRDTGENSLEYAKFLIAAGLLSFGVGDYQDAIAKDRKALEIENRLRTIAVTEKATAENNLGLVLMKVGSLAEAKTLLVDAVTLYKSDTLRVSPYLTDALNSLASTETEMGDFEAAAQHSREGLEFSIQLAGPQSELAAKFHNSIGCLALQQKKWRLAADEFAKALRLFAAVKGEQSVESAATLTNIGTLDDRTGKHKEAEAQYRAALRIHNALLGPEHPQIADDYSNVAAELFARKQWDGALELYRSSLRIRAKCYGQSSIQVANTWHEIAIVRAAAKRFDEAAEAYTEAVGLYMSSGSGQSQTFSRCLREYASLLRNLQRFSDAENADLQATRIDVTTAIHASH